MGKRILALIHQDGRPHLRAAVPASSTLQIVLSAADLTAALKAFGVDRTVVLDPAVVQADALELILGAVERTGAGMLLYSSLGPRSVERALEIVKRLPTECLFHGTDDVVILSHLLSQLPFSSVPALVLRRLAAPIGHLSGSLQMPVLGLFGWAPIDDASAEAREDAHVGSSSVRRAFHNAGLGSLARLRVCARLARVTERMLTSREGLEMIADREGFESLRTLEDQFARIVAVPPRQARSMLAAADIADRLADDLRR
jgi:hypothetical protein